MLRLARIALAALAIGAAAPAMAQPIEPTGATVHGNPLYVTTAPIQVLGYTVPAGFVTDLASIPLAMQGERLAPDGPWWRAAVLHDWLYVTQAVTRAEADRLFLAALREDAIRVRARLPMFLMVRVFGGNAYRARTGWNP